MGELTCPACAIRDCPRHCQGCGYAVAHNATSCINREYADRMATALARVEGEGR